MQILLLARDQTREWSRPSVHMDASKRAYARRQTIQNIRVKLLFPSASDLKVRGRKLIIGLGQQGRSDLQKHV
jgi:hypothetical protein